MLLLLLACRESKEPQTNKSSSPPVELIDYVNPMIATGGIGYWVNCGFPGAGLPLGMVTFNTSSRNVFRNWFRCLIGG